MPNYGCEQSQLFVCAWVFQSLVVTCLKSLDNDEHWQMWRGFQKRSIQSFAPGFTLFLPDWETLCWELGAGNDWVGIFNIFRILRRQHHSQRNPGQPTIIPPPRKVIMLDRATVTLSCSLSPERGPSLSRHLWRNCIEQRGQRARLGEANETSALRPHTNYRAACRRLSLGNEMALRYETKVICKRQVKLSLKRAIAPKVRLQELSRNWRSCQ